METTMAGRKKTEPEQPQTEAVKPSEVRKVISGKKLKELLNLKRDLASDMGKSREAFGQKLTKEFEKTPFDKHVLNFLYHCWTLTPERLALKLEDLDHGLEASGLNERAQSAPTLGLTQQEEGDDDESDPPSNVRGFPNRGSVAAE
jgi:hypothetical protein